MGNVNVQPGDFCCVPVSGGVGKLIQLGELLNGDKFDLYQHAEIYVGNPGLVDTSQAPYGFTFGAYPGGARLVTLPCPPEQLAGALWSSGVIPLTTIQRDVIIDTSIKMIGTGYSALDYFALAAHRLHLPIPGLQAYIAATGHQICSQLCDYIYTEAGVHLFSDGRWPGYVTPADLAGLIKAGMVK